MGDTNEYRANLLSASARPLNLVGAISRCVFVSVILSVGFGGLGFLRYSDRGSSGKLIAHDHTYPAAVTVAARCFPPFLCVAFLIEAMVVLLLAFGVPWGACQVLFPLLWCMLGAGVFFPQLERGPKETMLVSGGALLGYVGCGLQLALWRIWMGAPNFRNDFPVAWYSVLLLLSATFLGSLKGWTGADPQLRAILEYREKEWGAQSKRPPVLSPGIQEPGVPIH